MIAPNRPLSGDIFISAADLEHGHGAAHNGKKWPENESLCAHCNDWQYWWNVKKLQIIAQNMSLVVGSIVTVSHKTSS